MDHKTQKLWAVSTTVGPTAIIAFLILTLSQEYWNDTSVKKQNVEILDKERHLRILLQAAEKLKLRYERGDQEGLIERNILKCSDVPKSPLVNKDYLKCNPHYLNCFLAAEVPHLKNKFPVHWQEKNYEVRANPLWKNGRNQKKYYRIISKSQFPGKKIPHYAVQLNLSLEEEQAKSLNILLEDTCRDAYLPKRIYVYREHSQSKGKELIWNNFNRDIYIDKRLVTFRDLADWLEVNPEEKISLPQNRGQWALPASHLTIPQMEKYCHFLGKQVANTLIYDAASFYPVELQRPTSIDRYFPPLPWSKKKSAYQLFAIQREKDPFDKTICSDILTSECALKMGSGHNSIHQRTSWTGLKDLLGGHPEYLRNPINPQHNLRASSFYLSSASHWHHLGKRGSWSGKSFGPEEFTNQGKKIFQDNKKITTHTSNSVEAKVTVVPLDAEMHAFQSRRGGGPLHKKLIKVGFRCMFEGPGEA